MLRMRAQFDMFLLGTACLLWAIWSAPAGAAPAAAPALGPCEPGYVRHRPPGMPPIVRVAMPAEAATPAGSPQLEWLGHSSFLLTSPAGLRILIDPSALYPPSPSPEVVTVSNLHGTHNAVEWVQGKPRVLWGLSPSDGGWNRIAETMEDVSLFNIPSYASRDLLQESPVHNSIFVFHVGGFCIVHLGNLRHPLTAQQLQRLGTPDVVMIPIDGMWTMSHADVITVITQLQPRLAIPMHIDFAPHADQFARHVAERFPTRRIAGRTLILRRADLPAATHIVVFSDPAN
jgi:L-ascorbate metabolism protein UlaG (beta-lactamase superfamily)